MKKIIMIFALTVGCGGYAYSMQQQPMSVEEQLEHDYNQMYYVFSKVGVGGVGLAHLAVTSYADGAYEHKLRDPDWREKQIYILEFIKNFDFANPEYTVLKILQDDSKWLELQRVAGFDPKPYEPGIERATRIRTGQFKK